MTFVKGPEPEHGTLARYQRHVKAGEEACRPCKDAAAAAAKEYRVSGSPGADRDRKRKKADSRAKTRLRNAFPVEYEMFYLEELKREGL